MKQVLILAVAISLASCAASIKSIPLKLKTYSIPEASVQHEKELGDILIMKGEEETQEAYTITKSSDFNITMVKYPYSENTTLPLAGETKEWFLYYISDNLVSGTVGYTAGLAKSKYNANNVLPFINSVNGMATKKIEGFEVKPSTYNNPKCGGCFKKEFIYNGKSGNSLKFIYREYVNDLARPAFSQDLQYDLADGNTIGFKGLRLDVIKATNTTISYKIIKDFD